MIVSLSPTGLGSLPTRIKNFRYNKVDLDKI